VITVRPDVLPVTIPVEEPIVATDGALLTHVPPGVRSLSVAVDDWQADNGPLITAGKLLTVKVAVDEQPAPSE
jgi:hypothetical protein